MPDADTGQQRLGAKGQRTRARILEAAEEVFGKRGFHDASIAEITRAADVAQGSFYIYFPSKLAIFEELMRTRGRELNEEIRLAVAGAGTSPQEVFEAGFGAFFRWIGEHPWMYRVVRLAEFVDPALRENWYRSFADSYATTLRRRMDAGELEPADPDVLSWAIMGASDFTAMRWIVWEGGAPLTDDRLRGFLEVAMRALGVRPA